MLCYYCLTEYCTCTINVMWLFLTVPGVGLQCVIVVFSDRTHLRFEKVDFEVGAVKLV